MKLSVSQVEIYDDTTHALVAKVELEDVGVGGVTLHEKAFSAESWRELADAVAQAIKMMEAE
jgi:hypothetical protein